MAFLVASPWFHFFLVGVHLWQDSDIDQRLTALCCVGADAPLNCVENSAKLRGTHLPNSQKPAESEVESTFSFTTTCFLRLRARTNFIQGPYRRFRRTRRCQPGAWLGYHDLDPFTDDLPRFPIRVCLDGSYVCRMQNHVTRFRPFTWITTCLIELGSAKMAVHCATRIRRTKCVQRMKPKMKSLPGMGAPSLRKERKHCFTARSTSGKRRLSLVGLASSSLVCCGKGSVARSLP